MDELSPSFSAGPVDLVRAAAFLRARLGSRVTEITAFEQGNWSKAYGFRHDGRAFVVRFSPLQEDYQKDKLAQRYRTSALPIPRITEIGEAYSGYYAISERAFGTFLDDLTEDDLRASLPALFDSFDAMRLADVSSTTGYGIWTAGGTAPHATWRDALLDVENDRPGDRTYGWRKHLAAFPERADIFERTMNNLRPLVDEMPEERYLIHSDLLNYNVLVSGNRLSAVLDWGCGTYGDFLYDVATLRIWTPWYPNWGAIDFKQEAALHYEKIGLAIPNFERRMLCCQLHIGILDMAWLAFKEKWGDYDAAARRTLEIAAGA